MSADLPTTDAPVLRVERLRVGYGRRAADPLAVDDVSFALERGRTLGLIGESGSGKTTVSKALAGLVRPRSGRALLDGVDLLASARRPLALARRIQMVFQDPFASADPGQRIGDMVAEPLLVHRVGSAAARKERAAEMLARVGLNPSYLARHPHQLSGGQLQRVAVARALVLDPDVVLADEPLSALDVSIQAQVSNLLIRLQRELGTSMLFIGHDLASVRRLSDEIAVMYRGRIVESGPADEVYRTPRHPYTVALMSAVPQPVPGRVPQRLAPTAPGEATRASDPEAGCRYREQCWLYRALGEPRECATADPGRAGAVAADVAGHHASCHFSAELPGRDEYRAVLRATGLSTTGDPSAGQ